MIKRLEDSLNGGYAGLYREVVKDDCYRLKQLKFTPDLIFDIGANVGVFTRHCRDLFPDACIVALEPHPDNCEVFQQFASITNVLLIRGALGRGSLYHCSKACNGAHESYLSAGLGYPKAELDAGVRCGNQDLEAVDVPVWSLSDLVFGHGHAVHKTVMKIDCEGAENVLWQDEEAMRILRGMDYLTMELHYHALHGGVLPRVKEVTDQALQSLSETHDCERVGPMFYATRR